MRHRVDGESANDAAADGTFDYRKVPSTNALIDQKLLSLEPTRSGGSKNSNAVLSLDSEVLGRSSASKRCRTITSNA